MNDDDDLGLRDPSLAAALASIRDVVEEPPAGFSERLMGHLRGSLWWRHPVRRLAHDPRTQYAAASFVGAAAIALLWWRVARRAVGTSSGLPGLG